MNTFLLYLLKSSVLLSVFLSFFLLVMRRSEHFRFNRFTLLGGSALCLLLPLLHLRINLPTLYSEYLEPATVATGEESAPEVAATASGLSLSWQAVILFLFLTGALVTLGFYLYSYGRMFRLLRHTHSERRDGFILHLVPYETPSFSWMRHIVINREDFERHPAICLHEQAHVRYGHSHDLLLSSALTVLQWFNPLVWICRSELTLLHEYEADDFVLYQGINATQYQLLLVKKAVGEKRFLLANGFNHAQLKNRIMMMQNTSRAAWKKLFLLLLIPLLAGTSLLFAENTATDDDEPVRYSLLEIKPLFQGEEASHFAYWVNEHLTYPKEAKDNKLQGRVTLQFVIEKDGSVTNVKVLRGTDSVLDEEAVRIVSQSPKWTPGYVGGKPVRVTYIFPVIFQLK